MNVGFGRKAEMFLSVNQNNKAETHHHYNCIYSNLYP